MEIKLLFGADIVPTDKNKKYFCAGDIQHLFGNELITVLDNADFRCFNLETPLIDDEKPLDKPGPILSSKTETISAIKALNPSLLSIGNNHILDHGEEGLKSTLNILDRYGIPHIGAGVTMRDAKKPYVFKAYGVNIGIFNCSEYEFAAATEHQGGANLYDPLTSFDEVTALKAKCDFVIALYHGGKEFYRYPSPKLQRVCRKFVEVGADIVICQHTHCIGCEERYENATIIYGQGNFLFDRHDNDYWKTSLLVSCSISVEDKKLEVNYIPLIKQEECVRLANTNQAKDILDDFCARSKEISVPGFVEESYRRLAEQYYHHFVSKMHGRRFIFRIANKLTKGRYYERFYNKSQALIVLNAITCENEVELFCTGLKNKIR